MTFKATLTSCIEALERGESIESCLASYPEHADNLEPLLRIVAQLQQNLPQTRMSPTALMRGREIVRQAALKQRAEIAPLPASSPAVHTNGNGYHGANGHNGTNGYHGSNGYNGSNGYHGSNGSTGSQFSLLPERQYTPKPVPQILKPTYWPNMAMLAAAACLVLVASLVLRTTEHSLPGDSLYPVKRGSEALQGALMITVGERVTWHMDQVDRRVEEVVALEATGRAPDPALVAEVQAEAHDALAAAVAGISLVGGAQAQQTLYWDINGPTAGAPVGFKEHSLWERTAHALRRPPDRA